MSTIMVTKFRNGQMRVESQDLAREPMELAAAAAAAAAAARVQERWWMARGAEAHASEVRSETRVRGLSALDEHRPPSFSHEVGGQPDSPAKADSIVLGVETSVEVELRPKADDKTHHDAETTLHYEVSGPPQLISYLERLGSDQNILTLSPRATITLPPDDTRRAEASLRVANIVHFARFWPDKAETSMAADAAGTGVLHQVQSGTLPSATRL